MTGNENCTTLPRPYAAWMAGFGSTRRGVSGACASATKYAQAMTVGKAIANAKAQASRTNGVGSDFIGDRATNGVGGYWASLTTRRTRTRSFFSATAAVARMSSSLTG